MSTLVALVLCCKYTEPLHAQFAVVKSDIELARSESETTGRVSHVDHNAQTAGHLNRFCAKCSLPKNGNNISSFSESPEPSTIWMLSMAEAGNSISQELELTDDQLASLGQLELRVTGGFNVELFDDAIDLLSDKQERKLELAGLLLDGGVALRSRFFVAALKIDLAKIEQIESEIIRRRRDDVFPLLRLTFGGGQQRPTVVWKQVSDSVLLNHWIVGQLNTEQQEGLASLYLEAERDGIGLASAFTKSIYGNEE